MLYMSLDALCLLNSCIIQGLLKSSSQHSSTCVDWIQSHMKWRNELEQHFNFTIVYKDLP